MLSLKKFLIIFLFSFPTLVISDEKIEQSKFFV